MYLQLVNKVVVNLHCVSIKDTKSFFYRIKNVVLLCTISVVISELKLQGLGEQPICRLTELIFSCFKKCIYHLSYFLSNENKHFWFQLLQNEDLQLFYHYYFNIFSFLYYRRLRCHLGLCKEYDQLFYVFVVKANDQLFKKKGQK